MKTDIVQQHKNMHPKGADTKYIEGVGMRKTAVARVRIYEATDTVYCINARNLEDYFDIPYEQRVVREALEKAETQTPFYVSVLVSGSGRNAQAEAVRHGLARALVDYDPELRPTLKKAGFLKRDPRQVERKKFGLRKARKKEQWSKR